MDLFAQRAGRRTLTLAAALAVLAVLLSPRAEAQSARPQGIDVARYQGTVDWPRVAAAGIRFAFVKATEGTTYTSPTFAAQYSGAAAAGLYRSPYHFARPGSSSAAAQADHFLDVAGVGGDGITLPPVLDIENNPYGAACYGLSDAQMVAWIAEFLDTVRARTGRDALIYTSRGFWQACTADSRAFTDHPLWVAHWGVSSPGLFGGWSVYSFWQYTSTGSVPGVAGNVDRNVFNGDENGLRALAGQPQPPPPPPPGQPPGLDVSNHQGAIDWPQVAGAGTRFAFVKATEGVTYTSPSFAAQYAGAAGAGLYRGAYHVGRPDSSDPVTQADRLVDVAGGGIDGVTLPPALVLVNIAGQPACYGLTPEQMTGWVQGFLDTVEARTGRDAILHTDRGFWQACTGDSAAFTGYPLWTADRDVARPTMYGGWRFHSFWQSSIGTLPGVTGPVLLDRFNGGEPGLQAFAGT